MCKNAIVVISPKSISQKDEQKSQKSLRGRIQNLPKGNSVCILFHYPNGNFHAGKVFNGKKVQAIIFDDVRDPEKMMVKETIKKHHPDVENFFDTFDHFKENSHTVLDA